ncbi:MAG: SDR family oxidoreductase [Ferruginibacter sp.]
MNIVITGASKGIGKAIAEKFAALGNTLLLCSRNEKNLQEVADEIAAKNKSVDIKIKAADLSDKAQAIAFAEWCLLSGTPSILVNNAGFYMPGNVMDEPDGTLELQINTNLYSAYHITRKLLPEMIVKKSGHIFNICSIASLHAYAGGGGYSISKYAMHGFSQNLRNELKPHGIKVTAVFPGAVMTDSWGNFDNSNGRIMETMDVANMIYAASQLSPQAVVEDIVMRPQLGDLN